MMKKFILSAALALSSTCAFAAVDLVKTCQLVGGASHMVRVTRENQISDSYVYKLHYSGKTVYFFDDEKDSRGDLVQIICAEGKKERVLVASGEFSGGYRSGFALIYNRLTGKIERLDFAEKGAPEWLYLGANEAIVILPTYGLGENGATPYVAYRHIKGKAVQPEPERVEVPKPPAGYDAIKLDQ
jgi:hypothetical protein